MGIYIEGFKMPDGGYRTIEIAYDADGYPMAIADGGDVFDVIPAADVPVVLCKDCRNNRYCVIQNFLEDYGITPDTQDNFFCGYGEREKS